MIGWPVIIVLTLFMGFLLLLIEIFVVPGFGPVGIGAIVFIVAGTYLAWTRLSILWGIGITLLSIISVLLSIYLLKKMGVAKRFVLSQNITNQKKKGSEVQSILTTSSSRAISTGTDGIAISDLRPSGIAEFGNERVNVIADGIYIRRGAKVKIVRIEGNRVFVEEEGAVSN